MVGEQLGEDTGRVTVGIETDRGPWVRVYTINRCRRPGTGKRHGVSGAKSDAGDAHVLADMVRTDSRQLPVTPRRPRRRGWGYAGTGR
jgi:hypothetical protein